MTHYQLIQKYNIIQQTTLWSAYDSDIIRLQLYEAKDEEIANVKYNYYVRTVIDGIGAVKTTGYNDLDTAMHALKVRYSNYLYNSAEAPF